MPKLPNVSVVIPTFARRNDLQRLLKSISNSNYPKASLEVIIVDNASDPKLKSVVHSIFPRAILLSPGKNLFSNGARRLGSKIAKGKYIFLLDDDNVVDNQCIATLVDCLEKNTELGIVGPVMLEGDTDIIWSAGANISRLGVVSRVFGGNKIDSVSLPYLIYGIDYFPNACMVRQKVLKRVPLDDKMFPHNWAESDFGLRVQAAGYGIACVSSARERHFIGYTGLLTRLGIDKTYDQARSRILFRRRHMSRLTDWIVFWILAFPISSLTYTIQILRSPSSKRAVLSAYIKGTFDGLFQKLSEAPHGRANSTSI